MSKMPNISCNQSNLFFNNIDIAINLAEKYLLQMATDVIILLEKLKS